MFIYLSLQVLLEVETLVFLEFSLPLPEKIKLVDFFATRNVIVIGYWLNIVLLCKYTIVDEKYDQ